MANASRCEAKRLEAKLDPSSPRKQREASASDCASLAGAVQGLRRIPVRRTGVSVLSPTRRVREIADIHAEWGLERGTRRKEKKKRKKKQR